MVAKAFVRQVLFCRGATWGARLVFENTLTKPENPTYTWRARHVRAPTNAFQATSPIRRGSATSHEPLATNYQPRATNHELLN